MTTVIERPRHDATVTMRISLQTRDLIDSAAATIGKSRTDFMIESARQHAIDVLLEQRVFILDDSAAAAILNILDNPPAHTDQLRKLLSERAPCD